jgi:hypothetical protein
LEILHITRPYEGLDGTIYGRFDNQGEEPVFLGHPPAVFPEPDTVGGESKDFFSFEVKIHDTLLRRTEPSGLRYNDQEIGNGTGFGSMGRGLYPQGDALERSNSRSARPSFGLPCA